MFTKGFTASGNSAETLAPSTVDLLLIGGGGSSGYASRYNSAGGGAGGGKTYEQNVDLASGGVVYTVTIGAGGSGAAYSSANGATSSFVGSGVNYDAIGGGRGGHCTQNYNPQAGFDHGGGAAGDSAGNDTLAGGAPNATYQIGTGGDQTLRNGAAGGAGKESGQGSGSGTAATGIARAGYARAGDGGDGLQNSITGTATYYGGGGGGGSRDIRGETGSTGGQGGGGNGGTETQGTAGTDGLGGGGGGGGGDNYGSHFAAQDGGDGVVIMRIPTASYSGIATGSPTVTTDGSDTVVKWTSSGSYTTT